MKYTVDLYFGEGGVDITIKEDIENGRYLDGKEHNEVMDKIELYQPTCVDWWKHGLTMYYNIEEKTCHLCNDTGYIDVFCAPACPNCKEER